MIKNPAPDAKASKEILNILTTKAFCVGIWRAEQYASIEAVTLGVKELRELEAQPGDELHFWWPEEETQQEKVTSPEAFQASQVVQVFKMESELREHWQVKQVQVLCKCGTLFMPQRKWQVYCSVRCRNAQGKAKFLERKALTPLAKLCVHCKQAFVTTAADWQGPKGFYCDVCKPFVA